MLSLSREVETLRAAGVLAGDRAARLELIEDRRVVSLHAEIRTAMYAGVLLIMTGVGIFLKEHIEQIGPVAITAAIGIAAAACYAWLFFKRAQTRTPSLADDYILLLGSLLLSADVGYAESQFHLLNGAWSWHLFILAVVHSAAAYYFDSRIVLSLSVSSLAAFIGVNRDFGALDTSREFATRLMILTAVLLAWRFVHARVTNRPQFHPLLEHAAAHAGAIGALVFLIGTDTEWLGVLLIAVAITVFAFRTFREKNEMFAIYAIFYGLIAFDYVVIHHVIDEEALIALFILVSVIVSVVALIRIRIALSRSAA